MWCERLVVPLLALAAAFWLLVALCRVGGAVGYYAKFTFFILVSLVCATWPIPIMMLRPRDSRNALIPAGGLRLFSRFLGLKFKVRGKENIVSGSGCVVLINHQSCLDLLVLAQLWPVMNNCTVISKREVFYLWPFGLATWLWGTIFIDRLNPGRAQAAINTTDRTIRERRARVLMFPEGTRHSGLELLPFKKGAFHLAIAAGCPIQPVVVSNYHFLDDKTKRFGIGENIVSILPPIPTEGLTKEDLDKLMDKTWNTMSEAFKDISGESQTMINNNCTQK